MWMKGQTNLHLQKKIHVHVDKRPFMETTQEIFSCKKENPAIHKRILNRGWLTVRNNIIMIFLHIYVL